MLRFDGGCIGLKIEAAHFLPFVDLRPPFCKGRGVGLAAARFPQLQDIL